MFSGAPRVAYIPWDGGAYLKLNKCVTVDVQYTAEPHLMTRKQIIDHHIKLCGRDPEIIEELPGGVPMDLSAYSILDLLEEVQDRL